MSIAFSAEWAHAWGEALNKSPEYRAAAATWEGSIVATATGDEPGSAPEASVFLDLWHGDCRAARAATAADLLGAEYVLEGNRSAWRDLLRNQLAPLMALLTGRIQLTRGELAKLLPYVSAAKELVALAGTIDTEFPPGW